MVIFEAAKAITELNGVTNRELTPAITVLQLFLSSSKPVLRFAAVRTLNKVFFSVSSHPSFSLLLIHGMVPFLYGNNRIGIEIYQGNDINICLILINKLV